MQVNQHKSFRFFSLTRVLLLLFLGSSPLLLTAQSAENCSNGIDDDGDGLIDCYDPECTCTGPCDNFYYTTCNADCAYLPPCNQISLGVQWQSSAQTGTYSPLVAGDMDRDGIPDILTYLAESDQIYLIDGKTGVTKLNITCPTKLPGGTAPAIADLDNDGYGEFIFVGEDRYLRCWEHDGTLKFTSAIQVGYDYRYRYAVPNIADFDHNGWAEINIGNQVYNGQTGALLAEGGPNASAGEHPARKANGYSFCSTVPIDALPDAFCPDCDGLEIVAGNQVFSVNLTTGACIPVVTAAPNFSDGFTSVVDFDKDGDLDAIVQGKRAGFNTVYCWEIETPQVIRQYQLINNYVEGASRVNIADLNGDGQLEISFVGHPRLYALRNDFTLMWQRSANDLSSITCSSVFDFCGDGSADVIYRGSTNLQILEGATGAVKWQDVCGSETHIENPLVLDVDADGQTEIVTQCATGPYVPGVITPGAVTVYEAIGSPGIASRKVWNQHAYFNTNINDDLSVPRYQQNPHIVGDKLRINSFLNQYFNPTFPSPDGQFSLQNVVCDRDSLVLSVSVCNLGDNLLPATTPISVYRSNPQSTNAPWVGALLLNVELAPGACQQFQIRIPRIANDSVFLVLNDDHSASLPYNFQTDFPVTAIGECNFGNNLISFIYRYNPDLLNLGPDTAICANTTLTLNASGQDYSAWQWQNNSPLPTYTAPGVGAYSVTITDICGNTQTDVINISFDPATVVSLGANKSICAGETVSLSESGFDYYKWTPATSVNCPTCASVQAAPPASGNIILEAGFNNGCVNRDTVFVTVYDTFNIKIDTTICFGREVEWNGSTILPGNKETFYFQSFHGCDSIVEVRVMGTTVGTFYTQVDTAVCLGSTLPFLGYTLKPGDDRTYLLAAYTGCDSTVNVRVLPKDTFYVTESRTICFGESSAIFGSNINSSGIYQKKFSARNGCDSTHTVFLNVLDPILLSLESQSACVGETNGQILVNASGSAPPFNFQWNIQGATSSSVPGLAAGDYSVTVTDANDCTETAAGSVANFPAINIDVQVDSVRCHGESNGAIRLATDDPSLVFSLDQGATYFQTDAYENLKAADYTLFILDQYGCVDTMELNIGEPDEFIIAMPDDATIKLGDSLLLDIISNSVGPYRFNWGDTSYLRDFRTLNPIARPFASWKYALTLFDKNGCSASDTTEITVQRLVEVFIPTVFSPAAQDPQNQVFAIDYGRAVEKVEYLQVFDRWGNMLHEIRDADPGDQSQAWDGKFKGKTVQSGVFVWKMALRLVDGSTTYKQGSITLVR